MPVITTSALVVGHASLAAKAARLLTPSVGAAARLEEVKALLKSAGTAAEFTAAVLAGNHTEADRLDAVLKSRRADPAPRIARLLDEAGAMITACAKAEALAATEANAAAERSRNRQVRMRRGQAAFI